MLRIRRIFDEALPIDQREIGTVQQLLRDQFPGAHASDIEELPERLRNPFEFHFRSLLFVADDASGEFRGFALVRLDPAKGDPTGTWSLMAPDFQRNGRMIGAMRLPTLVVQEGGDRTRSLGFNARHFLVGLVAGQTDLSPPIENGAQKSVKPTARRTTPECRP